MMQTIKHVILILLMFVNFKSLQAQEIKSFEEYKKQEQTNFKKYVDEEKRRFEVFKKNELDWNREILGYEANAAVSKVIDPKLKESVVKPSIPMYVNLKASLKYDIIQLKRKASKYLSDGDKLISNESKLLQMQIDGIPSVNPITDKYRISSKFGNRFHPIHKCWQFHHGIDLACSAGTNVYTPANGIIVKTGWNNGYGNFIKVKHENGFETAYAHLSKIEVKKGQKVSKGDVIGKVGSSGNSTGPHLHYEILKNKKRVNPENFFEGRSMSYLKEQVYYPHS